MNDKYSLAVKLFELDFKIIPTRNKIAILSDWSNQGYIRTENELEYYFLENNCFDIAIRLDDLLCIDIDEHNIKKSGNESFNKFCKKYQIDEIETFYQQNVKTNAKHIIFKYDKNEIKSQINFLDSVDILTSNKKYVVISNEQYQTIFDFDCLTTIDSKIENAILNEQKMKKKKSAITSNTHDENILKDNKIQIGYRNNYLFKNAISFINRFDYNTTLNLVQTLNVSMCEPILNEEEVKRIVQSAKKYQEDSFYTLDRNVLKNKKLKGNDKCVYFYIKERYIENDYKPVLISQQDFLNDLNLSETTLKNCKKNLKQNNFIDIKRTRKKDVWGYSKYYINI